MSTYSCEPVGIFRLDAEGPVFLCPPIVVLGSQEDPERPAGKVIHIAWAERAEAEWHEAMLPTGMVANAAALEAILAPTGWVPVDMHWHDFIVTSAIDHLSGVVPPALAAAG
jgi:hypothetical protein